jgi:hypothetical protein
MSKHRQLAKEAWEQIKGIVIGSLDYDVRGERIILDAERGARHHMEACRALLKVPDDEVLYTAIEEMKQQLLAAQAAIGSADKELRELYHSYGDGTDVAQVIERVTHLFANHATALAEHDAALVKPLVEALERLRKECEKPTDHHELTEWTGLLWCSFVREVCDAALAKVKEGK